MGFFSKIKDGLKKTRDSLKSAFDNLFKLKNFNDSFYDDLEDILISADVGIQVSDEIINELKDTVSEKKIKDSEEVKKELRDIMLSKIDFEPEPLTYPAVIMLAGVNGVGKTTTIGKLANKFKKDKKNVVIAAADTFRAAASNQLSVWADRAGVRIIKYEEGADAAAVVYDAIHSAKAKKADVLIIDTAGRLHNKKNLMEELKKISRVVQREFPEADYRKYITIDATTGQNAIPQVKFFDEAIGLDGIVLTKLDGTAKGGIVLAICGELGIPVDYIGLGESIDDLEDFNAEEFIKNMV